METSGVFQTSRYNWKAETQKVKSFLKIIFKLQVFWREYSFSLSKGEIGYNITIHQLSERERVGGREGERYMTLFMKQSLRYYKYFIQAVVINHNLSVKQKTSHHYGCQKRTQVTTPTTADGASQESSCRNPESDH